MLKRLSYPLTWMENITGDRDDKENSLPSSAESSHPSHSSSVFSKVFSRYLFFFVRWLLSIDSVLGWYKLQTIFHRAKIWHNVFESQFHLALSYICFYPFMISLIFLINELQLLNNRPLSRESIYFFLSLVFSWEYHVTERSSLYKFCFSFFLLYSK